MTTNPYIEKRKMQTKRFYSAFRLYFHFVWVTKQRLPLLIDDIKNAVGQAIIEQCQKYEYKIFEMAIMPDHVHILLSLKPTDYLPDVARYLKGYSSRKVNRETPTNHAITNRVLKNTVRKNTVRWTDGYSVDSVGHSELPRIRRYIAKQREALAANGLQWYLMQGHLDEEVGTLPKTSTQAKEMTKP